MTYRIDTLASDGTPVYARSFNKGKNMRAFVKSIRTTHPHLPVRVSNRKTGAMDILRTYH